MPYIPQKHQKYNLLPRTTKNGGEEFDYPSELMFKTRDILPDDETLMPYGYGSYDEYFAKIDYWISYFADNSDAKELLQLLRQKIVEMNQKESWSVLQYLGEDTDEIVGLTHGQYYYWPCSAESTDFSGIIDDEEFTSYYYDIDAVEWEIAEDPSGMARETLQKSKKE